MQLKDTYQWINFDVEKRSTISGMERYENNKSGYPPFELRSTLPPRYAVIPFLQLLAVENPRLVSRMDSLPQIRQSMG